MTDKTPPSTKPDTRIIVVSCGEPTLPRCLAAIEASEGYGTEFDVAHVSNVAPVSAAFNEMLDLADREYHIQIDADMLLLPGTLMRMIEDMRSRGPRVWLICYPLWDTLFDRAISGVKIYRSECARAGRYNDIQGCEIDHNEQMARLGYKLINYSPAIGRERCVGDHVVADHKTAFWNCYERASRSAKLVKAGKPDYLLWVRPYFHAFLQRFAETQDPCYLWAWAGLIGGYLLPHPSGEKDINMIRRFFDGLPK